MNNACAAWRAPIEDFRDDDWDKVMDIDVKSLFFLANAAPHHLTLVLAGHLPGVAIYLAYRASYYLTGVVIAVDGGIGELAGTL